MSDNTIEYYNKNARSFFDGTVNADMSLWRDKFEKYLPEDACVMDAGCGSGRDSLAFKKHGYEVVAFDAAEEMCRMASELLGQEVRLMRFEDLDYTDRFDGIWACASLLHVSAEELPTVMRKIYAALKENGVLYVSFKYGDGHVVRGEREFTDMNEDTVTKLLRNAGFAILETGITSDIRPGREEEKWINAIARKK